MALYTIKNRRLIEKREVFAESYKEGCTKLGWLQSECLMFGRQEVTNGRTE